MFIVRFSFIIFIIIITIFIIMFMECTGLANTFSDSVPQ